MSLNETRKQAGMILQIIIVIQLAFDCFAVQRPVEVFAPLKRV